MTLHGAGVDPVTCRLEPSHWYDDPGEVQLVARWLVDTCQISTVDELLYLMEKPWKHSESREQMIREERDAC